MKNNNNFLYPISDWISKHLQENCMFGIFSAKIIPISRLLSYKMYYTHIFYFPTQTLYEALSKYILAGIYHIIHVCRCSTCKHFDMVTLIILYKCKYSFGYFKGFKK